MKRKQLKDVYPQYTIGDYSYGRVEILDWKDKKTFLTIGKFCSFARYSKILLGGEHNSGWATTYPFSHLWEGFENIKGHPATKGDVVIGHDVVVSTDAIILSGVTIGSGAIIGAGAVVTKDVQPYSIVGGIPAKFIRHRFDTITISQMLNIEWWNWKIERIKKAAPYLQNNVGGFIKKVYEGKL